MKQDKEEQLVGLLESPKEWTMNATAAYRRGAGTRHIIATNGKHYDTIL